MAPKKRKSTIKHTNQLGESDSYTDFLCPICLELLIEPVTLPCKHELCSACFEPHLENASLCCPMCRKRISLWVRENRKKNTLINNERWDLIQTLFPEQVKSRMEGVDDMGSGYQEYSAPTRVIAPEGELRKEYEVEVEKLQEEDAKILQLNLECIKELEDGDYKEMKEQEEIDRAAAHALQKEEMSNLGVTLASPTEHQKKLFELMRPKSPMKLRKVPANSKEKQKTKNKSRSNNSSKEVIKSPKCAISSYFIQSSPPALSLNKSSIVASDLPCCSKFDVDSDYELAMKLQSEFYSEQNESLMMLTPKRPLLTVSKTPQQSIILD